MDDIKIVMDVKEVETEDDRGGEGEIRRRDARTGSKRERYMEEDERWMKMIGEVGNGMHLSIQLEVEYPSKH